MANSAQFTNTVKTILESWQGPYEGHCFLVRLQINGYQIAKLRYGLEIADNVIDELITRAIADTKDGPAHITADSNRANGACTFFLTEETETPVEQIATKLEQIAANFMLEYAERMPECGLTLTCGIATIKEGDFEQADASARLACIDSRQHNRSITVFRNEDFEGELKRRELEMKAQAALQEDRFTFLLQPQVDLRTGKIVAAEALARGIGPDGHLVSPAEFIPHMEANGSIAILDFLVYRHVCEFMEQRLKAGKPVVRTSINLSRLHLKDPHRADSLIFMAKEHSIPAELIEFELTETVFLDDMASAREFITKLRAAGHSVAIDDFGTGYAGLNIWQELDFDMVKLDRSLLPGNHKNDERTNAILPNMIDIAKKLKVSTICEGAETYDQCALLLDLGCDYVQGYYYSKPLAPTQFYETYEQNNGAFTPIETSLIKTVSAHKEDNERAEDGISRRAKIVSSPWAIVVIAALTVILAASGILMVNNFVMRDTFNESVKTNAAELAAGNAATAHTKLSDITNNLDIVARFFESRPNGFNMDEMRRFMDALNRNTESYSAFHYSSIEEIEESTDSNSLWRAKLRGMQDGVITTSDVFVSYETDGESSFAIGSPLIIDGKLTGIAWATIEVSKLFNEEIANASPYGDVETYFVADDAGSVLALHGAELPEDCLDEITSASANCTAPTAFELEFHNETHYVALAPMGINNWRVGYILNANGADAVSRNLTNVSQISIVASVLLILTCAAAALFMIRQSDKKRRIEQERYRLLENFADVVLFEYESKTDLMQFTPNAKQLFGTNRHILPNFTQQHLRRVVFPADQSIVETILKENVRTPHNEVRFRARFTEGSGWFWLLCQYRYLEQDDGSTIVIGKVSDIDTVRRKIEQATLKAQTDSGTGLLNKNATETAIANRMAEEEYGALLVIDMDNFKQVNDEHGHAEGDAALRVVSLCLEETFHKADIVGRIGGDEFMVYVSNEDDAGKVQASAELLWEKVFFRLATETYQPSLSIGVAFHNGSLKTFSELYRRADIELYRAKDAGKCRVSIDGEITVLCKKSLMNNDSEGDFEMDEDHEVERPGSRTSLPIIKSLMNSTSGQDSASTDANKQTDEAAPAESEDGETK